jgi:hypothetical protein
MKIVTKQLLLVCAALTALSAFASCEVIASTAGQDISGAAETVWLSLTPTKPDFGDDGTGTAKLTLVFNKAIVGLTGDLDEAALANFFTFECDYPADFSKKLKATKVIKSVIKSANADAAVYTLTVVNIPATCGIALVTINKTGITPPTRPWSLNGQKIPDEDGPALLDFRFVVSAKNPSLDAEAIGSIDQRDGTVVVTVLGGTDLDALTPTVTVNPGYTVTPVGAQDFGNSVKYTVTAADGNTKADYWVTVTVTVTVGAAPVYGIALSGGGSDPLNGDYSFGEAVTGYASPPAALTVTVRNIENAETGTLNVGITGTSFDLSSATIASIGTAAGSNSATFTVQPKGGLGPAFGTESYSATITVSGGNITEEKTFTVSFTVKNWISAPSIALTPGSGQLGWTIVASDPTADGYEVYWVEGRETVAATVKAGTQGSGSASITGLTNEQIYSFIVIAHKSGYMDADSAIVYGQSAGYAVGDTGPAGGKIFYRKDITTDGWRYLEAAQTNFDQGAWASTSISGTASAIGSGAANTTTILAADAAAYAAKACADYQYGVYDDWFLPSIEELQAMYTHRASIGGFGTYYWSSSQRDTLSKPWFLNFNDGTRGTTNQWDQLLVRAVRAF